MKLLHASTLRFSLVAALVMAFWSVFFYFAIMREVYDEVDDSLEDYAELILVRYLAGEALPSTDSGTNNQYFLHEVTSEYADSHPHVTYASRDVYIEEKKEHEPARVLSYIFLRDDGQHMEIEVSTPTIEKQDLSRALFVYIVALYLCIMTGIVLVNLWSFRRSMKPLYRLLNWVDRYRIGAHNEPFEVRTNISEFRILGETVKRSLERNEKLYEQQKLFIGNASHEMQTPIAVCRSRMEALLDDETLTEEQMGEIIKTINTLDGMSRLNRSLLLLCKIDNGQFTDIQPIRLDEVCSRLLEDYRMVYASRGISVETDLREPFVAQMNPSLASVLVSNLLKNAHVHNRQEGGIVRVVSHRTEFRIENDGVPDPLDTNLIFTRFYHTAQKSTSTGLGLPLAQAICQQSGLLLLYSFEDGRHVFTVKSPST